MIDTKPGIKLVTFISDLVAFEFSYFMVDRRHTPSGGARRSEWHYLKRIFIKSIQYEAGVGVIPCNLDKACEVNRFKV